MNFAALTFGINRRGTLVFVSMTFVRSFLSRPLWCSPSAVTSTCVLVYDLWSEGCGLILGRSGGRIFCSKLSVQTLFWCLFNACVVRVAHKRPGHSAKSADVRLQLNAHPYTLEPTTSDQGNKLTCNSSGNACPQLSHFAETLLIDPWYKLIKNGMGARSWAVLKKRRKGTCREWFIEPSPKILACKEKATTTLLLVVSVFMTFVTFTFKSKASSYCAWSCSAKYLWWNCQDFAEPSWSLFLAKVHCQSCVQGSSAKWVKWPNWPHGASDWLVSLLCYSPVFSHCFRRGLTDGGKCKKKGLHWLRMRLKFLNLSGH